MALPANTTRVGATSRGRPGWSGAPGELMMDGGDVDGRRREASDSARGKCWPVTTPTETPTTPTPTTTTTNKRQDKQRRLFCNAHLGAKAACRRPAGPLGSRQVELNSTGRLGLVCGAGAVAAIVAIVAVSTVHWRLTLLPSHKRRPLYLIIARELSLRPLGVIRAI